MSIQLYLKWVTQEEAKSIWTTPDALFLEARKYSDKWAIPRLTAWYNNKDIPYYYSRQSTPAIRFPEAVERLRIRLSEFLKMEFDSCLANYYRDGKDSVSWHRDDESIFPVGSTIASVSLGTTRKFCFRKVNNTVESSFYTLEHRDLIVFDGEHKENWEHSIPKDFSIKTPRLNLTFRILK